MGANLKSSKGVAVGPDAISREPAAWARGATTAALFFDVFFFDFEGTRGERGEPILSNSDAEGSSDQRTHGAREAKLRETKKKYKKERKKQDLVQVEVKKKRGSSQDSRASLPPWLVFFPFSRMPPNRDLPGAARGDRGPDGHLRGQGESHSVCSCGKGELWRAGEWMRGGRRSRSGGRDGTSK